MAAILYATVRKRLSLSVNFNRLNQPDKTTQSKKLNDQNEARLLFNKVHISHFRICIQPIDRVLPTARICSTVFVLFFRFQTVNDGFFNQNQ